MKIQPRQVLGAHTHRASTTIWEQTGYEYYNSFGYSLLDSASNITRIVHLYQVFLQWYKLS